MKQIITSILALSISTAVVAVTKMNKKLPPFNKYQWLLKPGMTDADALNPSAYTFESTFQCSGSLSLCGIWAEIDLGPGLKPRISSDFQLSNDLATISMGIPSNGSGEVFFKD